MWACRASDRHTQVSADVQLNLNPLARTHLLRFSGVIVLQLMHWLGSYVQLVRSGSATHSTPDPMASVWVVGIPPPVFAGKTQGEYLAVCLSPPSPALVDGEHTLPCLCEVISLHEHICTHTHGTHTHAKLPPFTRAYLFLVVCILLLSWRWHTYAHAHTHKCAHVCAPTLTQESFMLPSKSLFS